MTFLTILGVMKILCSFTLVLERKTGKGIPQSSRLEFTEKFSANNIALSDAKDNNSSPLNRAICQKFRKQSFWEGMNSFVLVPYASLAASGTILQQLLACLNFTLDSEDLL